MNINANWIYDGDEMILRNFLNFYLNMYIGTVHLVTFFFKNSILKLNSEKYLLFVKIPRSVLVGFV